LQPFSQNILKHVEKQILYAGLQSIFLDVIFREFFHKPLPAGRRERISDGFLGRSERNNFCY
jgi:hypothetical protein